jgi:predicted nucleic acid-binding protein
VKAIFADTSFYAAWLSPRDALHAKAAQLAASNPLTVLTTEFVVVELGNFFSRVSSRSIVTEFIESMREDPDTLIVPVASELLQRGFSLFSLRPDKEWSLTDCTRSS